MSTPDMEPDIGEVLQREDDPEPTVKVTVEGPVRTQALPRKSAGIRGISLDSTAAKRLLTADPSRAQATIMTGAVAITIGGSKQEVEGGQPGQMPANQVWTLGASDELWASAASSTTVTVVQERWADG